MDSLIVQSYTVADLKEQGESKLSDGGSAVGGNIADRNAFSTCSITIHNIVTGCQYTDQTHGGAGIQKLLGDGGFVGHNDFRVSNPLGGLGILCTFVDGDITKLLKTIPGQVAGIDGMSVQNNDFHILSPFNLKTGEDSVRIKEKHGSMLWN